MARATATDDDAARPTGIGKSPVDEAVWVRDPGDRAAGLGSGLVGDFIGDQRHHGGHDQAVYAFAREDLDQWQRFLGRQLPGGYFGENLTTRGIDVNAALIGERWRIGATLELQVACPRIPCATFRGWVGHPGWLKVFTQANRPGAYLRVLTPGNVMAGDRIEVIHRPNHSVTVALVFRATTTEADLLDQLLPAGEDLQQETRSLVQRRQTATIDPPS
ncbi:MAG: MOSC domain-containing protein [Actinomycetota bacterium]|nr:MOSC domain-containing protein [Actinomycetota bacterium]